MNKLHLADPDDVGSSEYLAIHECLKDGLESCDEDEQTELAEAILETFIVHATAMLRQIRESNTHMEEDSASSSELMIDDVPAAAARQIVTAIRQYMFEKNGRWQWRELSGADFVEFVTLLLSQHDLVPEGCED